MEGGDDGVENFVDSKDMQQQSKAFDKLTDRVEDRQLDSTRVQEVCIFVVIAHNVIRKIKWVDIDLIAFFYIFF